MQSFWTGFEKQAKKELPLTTAAEGASTGALTGALFGGLAGIPARKGLMGAGLGALAGGAYGATEFARHRADRKALNMQKHVGAVLRRRQEQRRAAKS